MKLISASVHKTGKAVVIEDNTMVGGFGSGVLEEFNKAGINVPVKLLGFPDQFIKHGSRDYLFEKYKLDPESVKNEMLKLWK
jgi:1-deoxy-D-xylulose-5-phosphate synthase